MKMVKKKDAKEINMAFPGQKVRHEKFMSTIREDEKGPFILFGNKCNILSNG